MVIREGAIFYGQIVSSLDPGLARVVNLFSVSILIVISAWVIWFFYNVLSKRDLIELNLNKYNRTTHPGWNKFFASVFYLLEYIVIIPFMVFFWFLVMASILLVLAVERGSGEIILITAALVAATRILAYHKEEISKDLAKLFPFIAFSVFLLSPNPFNFSDLLVRISEVPSMFSSILYYLVFVVAIEAVLRFFYLIYDFWASED